MVRNKHSMAVGLIVAASFAASSLADQDASLVAHYTFEEGAGDTVKDWSGKGNHGKNHGAEYVSLGEGKGYVLAFDTPDAHVNCGNKPSLDLTKGGTIELWLYPETRPIKGEAGLVGKGFSSYLLTYSGAACWFYITTGSAGRESRADCSARVDAKSWHHVAATFDGTHARTYCDGKLHNVCKSKSPTINRVKDNFYLRYPVVWGDKVEPTFKCMMDEVRIYNRALTEEEIIRHYKDEVADKESVETWLEKVRLMPRFFPPTSTLVVEADFAKMELRPRGAVLNMELCDAARGEVVARHSVPDLPESGRIDWLADVADVPAGDYELRAAVMQNGVQIGLTSVARVKLPEMRATATPAWIAAYDKARVLNNLVAELLSVQTPQREPHRRYTFTNPRDGWVFMSSTASAEGAGGAYMVVDSDNKDAAAIVHRNGNDQTKEAMRHLPAGKHTLNVYCEGGAVLGRFVVRAVPEIIYAGLGYGAPLFRGYGPYTWQYLQAIHVLDNVNVILERNPKPENAPHLDQWRKQGKKLLSYYNTTWITRKHQPITAEKIVTEWSRARGLQSAGYSGIMVDELASAFSAKDYAEWGKAMTAVAADPRFDGRAVYPYTGHKYAGNHYKTFGKAVVDSGFKWAEECYLPTRPSEGAATELLDRRLRRGIRRLQKIVPDAARHMIMNLGFMSGPPEGSDVHPGVNYKVYLDMQMNLIANDPAYFGLYGFKWYHPGYVDEEILRWSAKLARHYLIEGKRERLTHDPYRPEHIRNPDFEDGAAAWTVEPAEKGSIVIRGALGYAYLQGRQTGAHDVRKVLVTRRSARAPNRFSQAIRKLTPGRLYSLKMYITDYGDLSHERSVKKTHHTNVRVEGVKLVPAKCFREVIGSGMCGHNHGKFDREHQLYVTYQRIVFRTTKETANLTISDWASDEEPGGPIGQELAFNFIAMQPYLED